MRAALDTNILAYAEGVNGSSMQALTLELVAKLPANSAYLPAQVAAELFNLLIRKAGRTRQAASRAVFSWQESMPLIETTTTVIVSAIDLANDHQFSILDSIVIASAAEAGCALLLSQDFQNGFSWRGVTVADPFATPRHRLLHLLLNS